MLTGATRVTDFTRSGCFSAIARAMMQPMECATKWKEPSLNGSITVFSIISTWSFSVYRRSPGLGLLPKPRRSTAKSLQLAEAAAERLGKTVSAHSEEEERNPCKKMTLSAELP